MSGAATNTVEIFRGLHVDTAPRRLARPAVLATGGAISVPDAAQEEALRQLRAEAVRLGREEGLRSGYEEGLRLGQADAASQVRNAVEEAVATALAPVQQERQKLGELSHALALAMQTCLAAAEDEMLALCFETLCRMLGPATVDPASVRSHLNHLVSLVKPGEVATLHVHPQDALLMEHCPATISFVADPEVAIGGGVLAGKAGSLDLRLETMLTGFKSVVLQARAQRAAAIAAGVAP